MAPVSFELRTLWFPDCVSGRQYLFRFRTWKRAPADARLDLHFTAHDKPVQATARVTK
jgi:hypothetical protein